ncbi:hypothetical protein GQ54DRAFT_48862 [Martensiomyces pterosporus]|nr:hypothetical protein GQ54DRAFT_48862 [Martensiomyces pterosporus]
MFTFRAPYHSLLSFVREHQLPHLAVRQNLVPVLRDWRAPFSEFRADEFLRVLEEVDARSSTLVFAQILVDAFQLAETPDHITLLDQALHKFILDGRFEQLAVYPKMIDRLAAAIGRIGSHFQQHEDACERLLRLVQALNTQMLEQERTATENDIAAAAAASTGGAKTTKMEKLGSTANRGVRPTELHIECLKQCILAHRRNLHARVAENVTAVKFDSLGGLVDDKAMAFMQYHYYAGMVHVCLGQMEEAIRMWQLVFAIPSKHISAIQIAAYKRLLLLHAIVHGTRARLPSFFPTVHAKDLDTHADAYLAFVEAFASKLIGDAITKADDMSALLRQDQNTSFVERAMHEMPAHQIRRASKAYSSIRVAQLAERIGFSLYPYQAVSGDPVASLAVYIQHMQDPTVVLQQDEGVVVFVSTKSTISQLPNSRSDGAMQVGIESQWVQDIEQKVSETNELKKRLADLDKHLALTKEYVTNSRDLPTNA